jgi:hypothetical protein
LSKSFLLLFFKKAGLPSFLNGQIERIHERTPKATPQARHAGVSVNRIDALPASRIGSIVNVCRVERVGL